MKKKRIYKNNEENYKLSDDLKKEIIESRKKNRRISHEEIREEFS